MHAQNTLSDLSCLLVERGIITTDVMPFCLINPNHSGHALTKFLRDASNDDIAEAFGITGLELVTERASCPTMEDTVAMLMARHSESGIGWLVRFYLPSHRGGYSTRLVYAPTIAQAMHRMLQA